MGLMRALATCVLCACSFQTNNGTTEMAPPDAPLDASGPTACFGSQGPTGFYFCMSPPPTTALTLSGTINDDNDCPMGGFFTMLTGPNEKVCAYAGAGVTIPTNFTAAGKYPIVIASTGDITITGMLDVSTPDGGQHGAGHNPPDCYPDNATYGTNAGGGAGGGGAAGGSFMTAGGAGGTGGGGTNGGTPQAAVTATVTTLRGGCQGGIGGDGNNTGGTGGNPGYGGGAVFLVARGTITIASSGTIDASGEKGYHGHRANPGGGASGGGSGGMILLDAQTLTVGGKLLANGGGAGGGADQNADGNDGNDPDATMPQNAAGGGGGHGGGGNGGAGFATMSANMTGRNAGGTGGGGGGGGGAGLIRVLMGGVPAPTNSISPNAQM